MSFNKIKLIDAVCFLVLITHHTHKLFALMNQFQIRLAQAGDQDGLNKLIRSPGVKWFGNIRPKFRGKDSLFNSYQTYRILAFCTESSALVAYAEFRNYPSIAALPTDCWLEWLSTRYWY